MAQTFIAIYPIKKTNPYTLIMPELCSQPPEPAVRMADIRRISVTSLMGFVNFAKHIIRENITFIEIITVVWYQTIKNNYNKLLLSFFSIFLYNKRK